MQAVHQVAKKSRMIIAVPDAEFVCFFKYCRSSYDMVSPIASGCCCAIVIDGSSKQRRRCFIVVGWASPPAPSPFGEGVRESYYEFERIKCATKKSMCQDA